MIKINCCKEEQGLSALQTPQKSRLSGLSVPCLIVSVCVLSLEIIERLVSTKASESWTRVPVLIADLTDLNSGGPTPNIRWRIIINEVI